MITKDYTRDSLFDALGLTRLKQSYMKDNEESPQDRFAYVSEQFGSNPEHAQRLYDYASKHWLSYSTPILSYDADKKGMAIACFLNLIPDTAEGLVENLSETNRFSMLGGGVGTKFGMRSASEKSTGVMPHLKIYDASSLAYKQGKCYLPGTEILTANGWQLIENISLNDSVACVSDEGAITFGKPTEIVNEDYSGTMYRLYNENRGIDFHVTEDHSMVVERKATKGWKGKLEKVAAQYIKKHNEVRFLTAGVSKHTHTHRLEAEEQFKIAFQADGGNWQSGCGFHFKKHRKINRLRDILDRCGYSYKEVVGEETTKFYVHAPIQGEKHLDWITLDGLTPEKANAYLEELAEWDGHRNREYSFMLSSIVESVIDKVQALAVIAGRSSRKSFNDKEGNRERQYTVFVSNTPYFMLEKLKTEDYEYSGKVHCCVVDTGKIVVRNGKVPLVCGNTRRGSYAAYLDISHPDIKMFLEIRKPTGDQNLRAMNMHHGINIPDAFMEIVDRCTKDPEADDSWELKDPNSAVVREVVSAKDLWQRIIETRMQTGEPYLHFIDESNRKLPSWLKEKGLSIKQSNLCSEIILPTNQERTAVCCLSSVNLEYFDEWKNDTMFLMDVAEMLDNVLQHFIDNAPAEVHRAIYSATQERSIGVGALGFHAYLQKNNIPWESAQAVGKNLAMFKHIESELDEANRWLGMELGEAPDAVGTGFRFSHTMAIAPNASSSIIMGNTSPSIEPYRANAYRQDTLSGSKITKNKWLDKLLVSKGLNEQDLADTWSSIVANDGSVQHLSCLDDWEKDVYKTALELDQRWVVQHASDRQQYIDQAQSVNLFFRPDANIKYIHAVHLQAWKQKLKTLYYCRSDKIGKADKLHEKIERDIIQEIDKGETECLACEG